MEFFFFFVSYISGASKTQGLLGKTKKKKNLDEFAIERTSKLVARELSAYLIILT